MTDRVVKLKCATKTTLKVREVNMSGAELLK